MVALSFFSQKQRSGQGPTASLTGEPKSTIGGDPLFGGIGGKTISTPGFDFSEGVLSRTGGFQDTSKRILGDLETNRGRFSTGFTEFTASRLQDIENARARTVGNLRSQLGRRGILGASFAQDLITRTNIGFAQEADRVRAEAQVAEAQLDLQNLQTQQQANQATVANQLAELGFAGDFISNINQLLVQRDQIAAQLKIAELNRRSGGGSIGSSSFSIGNFGRGGSSSGGFQGSTGTTATSRPIVGFDPSFNIASTINPNTPDAGGFTEAFQANT